MLFNKCTMLPYLSLNVLEFAKTFGLGIAVLLFWLFSLLKDIAEYKIREKKQAEDLLEIIKENIETMTSMTNLIEAIAPALSASTQENRHQIDAGVERLKEHITASTEILKTAIGGRRRGDQ